MHDESQTVDLAAIARGRAELANLAARFPELLTPAARERATAWLEGEVMAKRLDPDATGETKQLAVRLPADALAVLDAEAARLNSVAPGLRLTRADALRSILAAYRPPGSMLDAPAPGAKPAKPSKPSRQKSTAARARGARTPK